MSGDVQPRKRRDKKKKKEDVAEEVIFQQHQHQTTTIPTAADDLNIHIQKEASTGGGLCAKLVFFILLTVLTALVGLIITEHRGLTDLDTIDTDSRFAQIFEGWIDKSPIDHGASEELSIEHSEEDTHEDEEEDEDEEEVTRTEEEEEEEEEEEDEEEQEYDQDRSLDQEDEDEEEEEVSEEKVTDEIETVEETEEDKEESNLQDEDTVENESEIYESENENEDEENEEETEQDEEEVEQDEDDQIEEQEVDENEYASEEEDDEKYEASEVERDEASLPTKEDVTPEDEDEDESEEIQILDKIKTEKGKYVVKSQEIPEREESEETVDLTESEEAAQEETEESPSLDVTQEDIVEKSEEAAASEEDEIKKTIRPKKPVTKVHSQKIPEPEGEIEEPDLPVYIDDDHHESETYNMVVKFGVGTALLVVAHVVLVQKWRTEKTDKKKEDVNNEEPETPDLSRRNTIVTPPSLQEIEQDIVNVEEEYSEDDEDYNAQYDGRSKPVNAKTHYQDLQSTYSNTLTPDWEPKEVRERHKNYEEEEEEEEELEGDEDYDDEISENEDEELLQRLEEKYGKIRQSDEEADDDIEDEGEDDNEDEDDIEDEEELEEDDYGSWKRVRAPSEDTDSENERNWAKQGSGTQAVYDFENITNTDDWNIRDELDQAQQNLANDAAYALTLFNKILEKNPNSPRALYGKAQSLDFLAEQKRSNNLLQQAIVTYQQMLKVQKVPDALFQVAAERCIDRMRFRGLYAQSIAIHKLLIDKFPKDVKFRNHLAVTYLTMNKISEARKILHEILSKWPNDGFALVHYGFILKTNDNNLVQAVDYLKNGIATRDAGVIDGRFYFHLGDALTRLGRNEEAMSVYTDGVANKVFLSKYQRSLYNVKRLTGKPWWVKEDTPYTQFFENLENNWTIIRDEGLSILNKKGYFQSEAENLRDVGDWKQFELYARGIKNNRNCQQCPMTCKLVETLPDAIGCRRGQIKFSVMHPGTHVWPHCGPTNCRLRAHLGLKVPSNTYLRVGEEIRSWKEGKFIIFDDSFEHEVWHNGTATRLVLIIDIWHPELTRQEKQTLSSI